MRSCFNFCGAQIITMLTSQTLFLTIMVLGTMGENTEDRVFPDTCSHTSQCGHLHPFAVCRQVNLTSDSGTTILERRCACDQSQSFFFENETCVKHVRVLRPCEAGRGRCVDRYTACVDDGSGMGYSRCMCQAGTKQVRGDDGFLVCARIITVLEDPLCRACEENGGQCYDLDEDGVKNGCICPASLSGSDCQHIHVHVTCEKEIMTVCYDPHPGFNFSDGARVYVDGAGHLSQCVGVPAEKECGPGQLVLHLPLDETRRHTCSTLKHRPDDRSIRYENMLLVKKGEDATGGEEDMILFNTYCAYKTQAEGGFMGQKVYGDTEDNVGERRNADVTFSVETATGDSIPKGVMVKTGDSVKFRLYLDTASGYETVRVDSCLLSNLPITHRAAKTLSVVEQSCPALGQSFFDMINYWHFISPRKNEMETGLVRVQPIGTGTMVYLQCNLRVCLRGYEALCDPIACQMGKMTRRSLEEDRLEVKLLHVSVGLAVWEGRHDTAEVRGDKVSIGPEVVIGLSVVFVLLSISVVVVIYFLTSTSRLRRSRDDRQGLHKGDAKDYGTDAGRHTSQTRI